MADNFSDHDDEQEHEHDEVHGHDEDHPQDEEHHEPPPPRRRRGRGPTKLRHIIARAVGSNPVRERVELDEEGVPTGHNASTFITFLGLMAKEHIDISKPDWKDVIQQEKDTAWRYILVSTFTLYFTQLCS